MADKWPDETTRALLTERAAKDADEYARGAACTTLGGMHSEFGRILFRKDLHKYSLYLNPLKPVACEHIEKAAKKAGVAPTDIDAQVASLSAHVAWDITRGLRLPDEKPG